MKRKHIGTVETQVFPSTETVIRPTRSSTLKASAAEASKQFEGTSARQKQNVATRSQHRQSGTTRKKFFSSRERENVLTRIKPPPIIMPCYVLLDQVESSVLDEQDRQESSLPNIVPPPSSRQLDAISDMADTFLPYPVTRTRLEQTYSIPEVDQIVTGVEVDTSMVEHDGAGGFYESITCGICDQLIKRRSYFKQHLLKHYMPKLEDEFGGFDLFFDRKAHIESVHLNLRYSCTWTTGVVTGQGQVPRRAHTKWSIECQLCEDQFDIWWDSIHPGDMNSEH